jgi:hypothetical protein
MLEGSIFRTAAMMRHVRQQITWLHDRHLPAGPHFPDHSMVNLEPPRSAS